MTASRSGASYLRVLLVVAWVAVSSTAIVMGYWSTSPVLAWQMFPEASTMEISVTRVTSSGERIDIDAPWPGGYRWSDLVEARGLGVTGTEIDAAYGVEASLEALHHALDWVATHTPDDHETRLLEAEVTYRHNDDPPRTVVLRSVERSSVR